MWPGSQAVVATEPQAIVAVVPVPEPCTTFVSVLPLTQLCEIVHGFPWAGTLGYGQVMRVQVVSIGSHFVSGWHMVV